MLHDKATTSQPLGRCFDSREGRGEPGAPLPVWAAEPSPGRGETRLGQSPVPSERPSCLSGGGKLRFPAAPPKRGVRAVRRIVDTGESQ